MKLIIVQGESATGKTTLVKRLATDLNLPYFMKDDYKERRYDELGKIPSLRQWSKIDNDSWEAIYAAIQQAVDSDGSLIIEGNFWRKQRARIRKIVPESASVAEVFCTADPAMIWQRFHERHRQGNRHPGHRDHLWGPTMWLDLTCSKLGWHWIKPVGISQRLLRVDTTDFSKLDYQAIKDFVA